MSGYSRTGSAGRTGSSARARPSAGVAYRSYAPSRGGAAAPTSSLSRSGSYSRRAGAVAAPAPAQRPSYGGKDTGAYARRSAARVAGHADTRMELHRASSKAAAAGPSVKMERLRDAVIQGDLRGVEGALAQGASADEAVDPNGDTALHKAAQYGHTAVLEALVGACRSTRETGKRSVSASEWYYYSRQSCPRQHTVHECTGTQQPALAAQFARDTRGVPSAPCVGAAWRGRCRVIRTKAGRIL